MATSQDFYLPVSPEPYLWVQTCIFNYPRGTLHLDPP